MCWEWPFGRAHSTFWCLLDAKRVEGQAETSASCLACFSPAQLMLLPLGVERAGAFFPSLCHLCPISSPRGWDRLTMIREESGPHSDFLCFCPIQRPGMGQGWMGSTILQVPVQISGRNRFPYLGQVLLHLLTVLCGLAVSTASSQVIRQVQAPSLEHPGLQEEYPIAISLTWLGWEKAQMLTLPKAANTTGTFPSYPPVQSSYRRCGGGWS